LSEGYFLNYKREQLAYYRPGTGDRQQQCNSLLDAGISWGVYCAHTQRYTHTHTHTRARARALSLSLSLSLTHTHTHTRFYSLSFIHFNYVSFNL